MSTTAVFGGGVMGSAIIAALVRSDTEVLVVEPNAQSAARLRETYNVDVVAAEDALARADSVLIVVKPHVVASVTPVISAGLRPETTVICMAAGLTTADLEAQLPPGASVIRVMPNTPAVVGQGMAVMSPGSHVSEQQLADAQQLLSGTGKVTVVPEPLQNACTAVSGSGPAYLFYVADAMIEAGVVQGIPRAQARELVTQTLLGAATMLDQTGEHPALLREQVTSPGGTTAAALRVLDDRAVRASLVSAVAAAAQRSAELADS